MAVSEKVLEMMQRSSWIRKMFETGIQLREEFGAGRVCDFSLGNPNVEPPADFFAALREAADDHRGGVHGYMPNAGYPDARRAVAEYVSKEQNCSLSSDHIVLSCGAGGAMNAVLKSILNPGDEVIVSSPFFMEYTFYADNHGGALVPVASREGFELDIAALAEAITPKTAAMIINSPNNPTGVVYSRQTISELGAMLKKKSEETGRSIYLISDEPYRKIVFDQTEIPSVFSSYKDSIIVTSYSKDLSIPGERIGYIAVHPEAADVENLLNAVILSTRILGFVNAPALMQRVITRLQGSSVDAEIYRRKRDLLCSGLEKYGYEFTVPKGTFYLMPKAPGGDDLKFVDVLQQELILTVPGRGFGAPGYFRISFCVDDEVIKRSMSGFERAIGRMKA